MLIYVNPWGERVVLLVVFARYPNGSDLKEAVMQRRQALKLFACLDVLHEQPWQRVRQPRRVAERQYGGNGVASLVMSDRRNKLW